MKLQIDGNLVFIEWISDTNKKSAIKTSFVMWEHIKKHTSFNIDQSLEIMSSVQTYCVSQENTPGRKQCLTAGVFRQWK